MSTLTVTGKVGPGLPITALPLEITEFTIKCDRRSVYAVLKDDRLVDINIPENAVITILLDGTDYTITIEEPVAKEPEESEETTEGEPEDATTVQASA